MNVSGDQIYSDWFLVNGGSVMLVRYTYRAIHSY